MRKHTKKEFKEKVEWFIENKSKISRTRRRWYLNGMQERYAHFIPYKKYGYYGDVIVVYISDQIEKKIWKNNNA
jgi:hypothetical protein